MILRVLLLLTIGSIGTIVHVAGNNQTRLCGDKSISIKRDDFSAKPECVCGNETLAEEDAKRYYCCIPPGSRRGQEIFGWMKETLSLEVGMINANHFKPMRTPSF